MKFYFSILALSLMHASCGLVPPKYDLVCVNVGKIAVKDVDISYSGRAFSFGILSPHAVGTRNRVDEEVSIPERANITWLTEQDGKRHKQEIVVKSKLSTGNERGALIFWIDQDRADVAWRTELQWSNTIYKELNSRSFGRQ